MQHKIKFLFFVTIILLCSSTFSYSQSNEQNKCTIALAEFMDIVRSKQLAGGFVKTQESCLEENETETPLKKEITTNSLYEAMNSIILKIPQYTWTREKGVINLTPINDEPKLLGTKFKTFRINKGETIWQAMNNLINSPEVKEKIKKLKLKHGIQYGRLVSQNTPKTFDRLIKLENTTFLEVLNEIVRLDGQTVWYYYEAEYFGSKRFKVDLLRQ